MIKGAKHKKRERNSIAGQIRANTIARANGYSGAVWIDGAYRPYSGDSPWYEPGPELSADEVREKYLDWGF